MACNTSAQSATPAVLTVFVVNSVANYATSFATSPIHTKPIYNNLCK